MTGPSALRYEHLGPFSDLVAAAKAVRPLFGRAPVPGDDARRKAKESLRFTIGDEQPLDIRSAARGRRKVSVVKRFRGPLKLKRPNSDEKNKVNFVVRSASQALGRRGLGGAGSQWAVRSWPRRSGLKWITTTIAIAIAAATTASA